MSQAQKNDKTIKELYLDAKFASQKFSDAVNPKTMPVSDADFERLQIDDIKAMYALRAAIHSRFGVTLEELQSL